VANKNYIRVELIGGGGFADVYRAVLEGTPSQFALKLLRDYRNPDARHRFKREVEMIRGIKHRAVIRLIDANTDAEQPFYVMPLMTGGPLTRWAGALAEQNLRRILVELVDFLAHFHAKGGLHRDIKPDNLLVDASRNFVVGDFGLGNHPRFTVMMTAHAAGTWGYAAPELTQPGAKSTQAADIYSLGATMFHLATGVHPAKARQLDPWSERTDISAELRNLIVGMVQDDPRTRPTADQLRNKLTPPEARRENRAKEDDGWKVVVGFGIVAAIIAALS